MSLSFTGKVFDVWAQIALAGVDHSSTTDVTFSVLNGRGSDIQEAVWWVPTKGRAIVALGNSSGTSIQTRLEYSDGDSEVVNIQPNATEYVRLLARGVVNTRDGSTESLRLTTVGPAGSLKVAGVIASAEDRLVSSIRFYDTRSVVQPNLYATNVNLRGYKTRILLKNTSATALVAQARFLPAAGEGADPVVLPAVTLRPDEIIQLDLSPLTKADPARQDLDTVSVQITNSGAPGSLIGAINGLEPRTNATYDVPLRDSGINRVNSGAYPVRLDGDFTTMASITNVGNTSARFIAEVYYPGGRYLFGDHGLAIGETAFFDLRKIRDERIPDANGDLLPKTLVSAQFRWHWFPNGEVPHMIGRAAVASLSRGFNASYSCIANCGAHGPEYSVEGNTNVLFATSETMSTKIRWYGASGGYNEYNTNMSGMTTVDNTSTASLDNMTTGWLNVNGLDVGDTYWWWTYWYSYDWDNGFDCAAGYEEVTRTEPTQVVGVRYTTVTSNYGSAQFTPDFTGHFSQRH